MAAMTQPFNTHPGMAGHGGVSHGGQPMIHGHPSNQGLPGGQPMGVSMSQPMHPGLAGPGGPQVTQGGPMMAMMPGGGPPGGVSGPTPSAHALQHLNPQTHHNPMFPGPQMPQGMANNPQLFAAQQQNQQRLMAQQRILQQQQQQQIQQQQQQQQQQPNGGMMPNSGNPSMTEAQFQLMNNQAMPTLPSHLQHQQQDLQNVHNQQQQQQQQRMHQQQQIQQQQQQQQQQRVQGLQHAQQAQHRVQQHQQQQIAAQRLATQQQQQQAASNPATTQGQSAPQSQINPQSQIPTGPDPPAALNAQRQAQQQQLQQQAQRQVQMQQQQSQRQQEQQQSQAAQQQQTPQQSQQQQQGQGPPQQQTQQPQPQPQQPPQSQQQGQQQQQQQQQAHPPQQPSQQTQQQAAQHQAQIQQQRQHAAQAAVMMQQPGMQGMGANNYLLKLYNFGVYLSQASLSRGARVNMRVDGQSQDRKLADDFSYWTRFVDEFFSAKGVLKLAMVPTKPTDYTKHFEISTPALARYYFLHFSSGIQKIQMFLDSVKEKNLNGGIHILEANSTFVYWSQNGHQLVATGPLRAQFDMNGKMDILDLSTNEHNEYIPRNTLIQTAAESPDIKFSPNASKSGSKKAKNAQKQQQPDNQPPQVKIPESAFYDYGTTRGIWHFLELAEIMSTMVPLFQFSHQRSSLTPADALANLCNQYTNQQQQQSQPQQPPHQQQQQQHQQNPQFNPAIHHPGQQPPHQQNLNAFQQNNFLSPAHAAHLSLPNNSSNPSASPATLSNHPTPSMQNLALQNSMQQGGVPMAAQASHQGTNPSAGGTPGGSANASPSVTGKRRRPSGVGLGVGGGEDVVEVNGVGGGNKVKQSPRVTQKRQKGNG